LKRDTRSVASGFITAEIKDLQEPWMTQVDAMLADEAMVSAVRQVLARRHRQSRRRLPAQRAARLRRKGDYHRRDVRYSAGEAGGAGGPPPMA
jgi:hypothetical protein